MVAAPVLKAAQENYSVLFSDDANDISLTTHQYTWRRIPEHFNLLFVIDVLYSPTAKIIARVFSLPDISSLLPDVSS
jgi:hypothetical protein